ncbi:ABC-type transport auxiliary lipoprotein family protein [Roseateles saccharophilus]|uniref:Cholesterol transport system auxiliary component n=1 Tax=Roseateles saccharophilus TaxID=304 RepID=A0A4R3VH04_ROSSA|nr:ABC-type transport auxiliary lipoprotein family protein [Roseateles saccharophilus]MDG0835543.1 ABC transporter [Roseateles saccharophilus]TCV03581.1 cholesterol transport system auxiliary component [Roseateles saccharophilus]
MTLRLLATTLAALLLSACSLAPVAPAKTVYDLGPAPAAPAGGGGPLAWRIADVTAPPWLGGDGIAYRLGYEQALRQQHYRDSVWAAPPAALLTQRLRERLDTPPGCANRPAALLAVSLDEFEQVFTSPASSQVVLRVHATLWPAGATGPTLQQHWRLERPAATPDAAGAVRGLAQAVDELLPQLADWLVVSACR